MHWQTVCVNLTLFQTHRLAAYPASPGSVHGSIHTHPSGEANGPQAYLPRRHFVSSLPHIAFQRNFLVIPSTPYSNLPFSSGTIAGLAPERNVDRKCVACVDDDVDVLRLRELLLRGSGYAVITATSGQKLLTDLASGAAVDIVLLDYLMPAMNGDELAEKLRQRYPRLPLIAVSAVPQLPDSMLRLVDATVQKGSDPNVLLSAVEKILTKPSQSNPQIESTKATILCVDDEDLQLSMRKKLFESAGYRVLEAQSAAAGLDIFRSVHVDAVVLDYWLSGVGGNGTALAEKMKRLRPGTPILMLSGLGALPGESAIVDSWLSKGQIEPQDLVAEVEKLIEFRSRPRKDDPSEP